MSAVRSEPASFSDSPPSLRPITVDLLDAVMAIEIAAYAFPWTRGNFIDSIAAGYVTRALQDADGELLGYFVAMPGFEEMHLLNVTVALRHQGRGFGRALLAQVYVLSRACSAAAVWLEVRASNVRAHRLYVSEGFTDAGLRRGYYPSAEGPREDAILMSKLLPAGD